MPPSRLDLPTALARALASAHNDVATVTALAAAFARVCDLAWIELAVVDASERTRVLRLDARATAPTVRFEARLRPRSNEPHVVAPPPSNVARGGVDALVVLPLLDVRPPTADGAPAVLGEVVAAVRGRRPAALAHDAALRLAAVVVAASIVKSRAVARVAEVSRRAYAENRELKSELGRSTASAPPAFRSAAMRRLFDDVLPLVAPRDVTVLVLGETGVGKELVARRIHALSRRAARPMLSINCGAIPEALVDATLFGHERGAFTGAHAHHAGVFERADRGTLFLDEIGELALPAQARLLRVLEHGEIERVGAARTLRVDVRIIAATHRDLAAMVAARAFREDLRHRLEVVPLRVPPLRERPDDIEPIARAILERAARRAGLRPVALGRAALAKLRAYAWPGNVRELENVLERAVLFGDGVRLALDDLAPDRSARRVETFAEASRRAIEAALAASGGRIHGGDGAAARLGLKPTTLQSKMRKLGIVRPRRKRRTRAPRRDAARARRR